MNLERSSDIFSGNILDSWQMTPLTNNKSIIRLINFTIIKIIKTDLNYVQKIKSTQNKL